MDAVSSIIHNRAVQRRPVVASPQLHALVLQAVAFFSRILAGGIGDLEAWIFAI